MVSEQQLIQLRRILGLPGLDASGAAAATHESSGQLAAAFFAEAADSDDVISREAALDYLESRLSFFGNVISLSDADALRIEFAERLKAWDSGGTSDDR